MADTIVCATAILQRGQDPASWEDRLLKDTSARHEAVTNLSAMLEGIANGTLGAKLTVRVDGSTGAAAAGTVVVESDDTAEGDQLLVTIPGFPTVALAAVLTDEEVVTGGGQWSLETATDTAQAQSLRDAINNHPALRKHVVATESSGTVTVTALRAGTGGNNIVLAKDVATAGALTITAMASGADIGDAPDATCTFGSANIANDDTIRIGSVLFTWKASASNENEITSSSTEATAAANFLAKVNAHSQLNGLILATADSSAVVRLTWLGDPRSGELIYLVRTETNSGSVTFSAATLGSGSTEAYQAAPKTYTLGAP